MNFENDPEIGKYFSYCILEFMLLLPASWLKWVTWLDWLGIKFRFCPLRLGDLDRFSAFWLRLNEDCVILAKLLTGMYLSLLICKNGDTPNTFTSSACCGN